MSLHYLTSQDDDGDKALHLCAYGYVADILYVSVIDMFILFY